MTSTRDAYRRRQAHRSTLAGVGGIVLMAVGIILTIAHVDGYLLPTLIA